MANPSQNGSDGRDERGRFAPGNPGGPGNPYARQTGKLRSAHAIADPDLVAVIGAWLSLPKPVKAGILALVRAAKG